MYVYRSNDLQIVDYDYGPNSGLSDVTGDFPADKIQPGFVVTLPKPETTGVSSILFLCNG